MFSGIVEEKAEIVKIQSEGTNVHFTVQSSFAADTYIDQSIAHNGVCLTVVSKTDNQYQVTAIQETLNKTNLGQLAEGAYINIERCLLANSRIDGHFVQGHVDTTGTILAIDDSDGSWIITIQYPESYSTLLVSKGSVCIDGISLTVIDPSKSQFQVAIIPYTFTHTNLHTKQVGDSVNLEFDIFGKYVARYLDQLSLEKT